MADVFISYKSIRKPAAQHLAKVLECYGYSVWWDYDLAAGSNFGRQIESQLKSCKAVVVLWCSLSVESKWVLEEAHLASELHKIIPIWVERVELPFGYKQLETLDLSQWDGSPKGAELEKLLRELARLTGKQPRLSDRALNEYERSWRLMGAPRLLQYEVAKKVSAPGDDTIPRFSGAAKKTGGVLASSLALWVFAGLLITASAGGYAVLTLGEPRAPETFFDCDACPEMVKIPPGTIRMGSAQDTDHPERKNEWNRVDAAIKSAFAVSKREITQGEFAEFLSNTKPPLNVDLPKCFPATISQSPVVDWRSPGFEQNSQHPVVCVSWENAQAYAEWLTIKTGHRYRLLSEAEWEFVATEGGRNPDGPVPTDTRSLCEMGNVADRDARAEAPKGAAGDLKATCTDGYAYTSSPVAEWSNKLGVADLIGNVREWTADCYLEAYDQRMLAEGKAARIPDCQLRVTRGGSWESDESMQRIKRRGFLPPTIGTNYHGFRVARDL